MKADDSAPRMLWSPLAFIQHPLFEAFGNFLFTTGAHEGDGIIDDLPSRIEFVIEPVLLRLRVFPPEHLGKFAERAGHKETPLVATFEIALHPADAFGFRGRA